MKSARHSVKLLLRGENLSVFGFNCRISLEGYIINHLLMISKNQVLLLALVLVLTISQTDSSCASAVNNTCVKCYSGSYLNTLNACIVGNSDCATFTTIGDGSCATCWSGSVVIGTGCGAATAASDANCKNTNSSGCAACYTGFYINTLGVCTAGNTACATFTTLGDGSCATCWPGY